MNFPLSDFSSRQQWWEDLLQLRCAACCTELHQKVIFFRSAGKQPWIELRNEALETKFEYIQEVKIQ